MNLVLIGYRCSGKTTVGRRVAARLKMRFVDTDDQVEERQGAPISVIVGNHGWDHFRTLEKQVIQEISTGDGLVIALGGGAILEPQNVAAVKKNGLLIWLKADLEDLLKRMGRDPGTSSRRPTLTGLGSAKETEEVLAFREPFYRTASEVQLDTSVLDPEAVVEKIISFFEERRQRN